MKKFSILAVVFLLTISVPAQKAQKDLLKQLLDLPAPAPGRQVPGINEKVLDEMHSPEFFAKSNVPPDDAPLEDLIAYWSHQVSSYAELRYKVKPSERVVERLIAAVDENPQLAPSLVEVFPAKPDIAKVIKRIYDQQNDRLQKEMAEREEEFSIQNASIGEVMYKALDTANRLASGTAYAEDDNKLSEYQVSELKEWLTHKSDYFSDELLSAANKVRDTDEYVTNQRELLSLARVDWKKAEPIVERLLADKTQPVSQTLANWAYYTHSLKIEDESAARKHRRALQDIVEDKTAKPGARDLALDALVNEGDWSGRDEWYLSLLEDETLLELKINGSTFTGLTTLILDSPPDRWVSQMIDLVGHKNQNVHNAAVRNLTTLLTREIDNEKEILRALLPWLSDPTWAKDIDGSRNKVISAIGETDLPESIPGLIAIVQNEEGRVQNFAINALSNYRDPRIFPILQSYLAKSKDRYENGRIIRILLESGTYSAAQQVNFVEKFIEYLASRGSIEDSLLEIYYSDEEMPIETQIGMAIIQLEKPDDDFMRAALQRIEELKRTKPQVAKYFDEMIQTRQSPVLDLERLREVSNGSADIETILRLLTQREQIQRTFRNEIYSLRQKGGFVSGIANCLLEDELEMSLVLKGKDNMEKTALLGCARLIRGKLPVQDVASLLQSSDELLRLAAERYLISEDSAEARYAVLANHPNEALILGARTSFNPEDKNHFENQTLRVLFASVNNSYFIEPKINLIKKVEKELREEILQDKTLNGIYAFVENEEGNNKILRIYKDRAVYTWFENQARYKQRVLTKEELDAVFRFVSETQVEEKSPYIYPCHHMICPTKEFIMFGRNGGRRVFVSAEEYPQPLAGLRLIFEKIESGESKLHYRFQSKIEGLEVLLADSNLEAKSVYKQGNDFKVLVLDKKLQKQINDNLDESIENLRKTYEVSYEDTENYYEKMEEARQQIAIKRAEREYESYSWQSLRDGKIQGEVPFPPNNYFVPIPGTFPIIPGLEPFESLANVRTPAFEIRKGDYRKQGIWKVTADGSTSEISEDSYENPVVTPDGRWLIGYKSERPYLYGKLYRIDLQNNKATEIEIPKAPFPLPVAYVVPRNQILLRSAKIDTEDVPPFYLKTLKKELGEENFENLKETRNYLYNANTGALTPVEGEFRPLEQITYRYLQPTRNAGEYWAAIYDEKEKTTKIGRYDLNKFKLKEILELPDINLSSMDIWIDETESKVYFVYDGHLLSVPLAKKDDKDIKNISKTVPAPKN